LVISGSSKEVEQSLHALKPQLAGPGPPITSQKAPTHRPLLKELMGVVFFELLVDRIRIAALQPVSAWNLSKSGQGSSLKH
jgi:hypothetical protein